mgnify:CR=1 FL=1
MKIAHISLGPTCVPAEILKASGLRTCTFGFDWFRSGSFFVEEFLNISLPCFLDKYVINPCIPLRQMLPSVLESSASHTMEPSVINPIYGYTYLYNPHRVLDDPRTAAYYKRSFDRLRRAIYDSSTFKRYFVADYVNKEHAIHLDSENEIIDWFKRLSLLHGLSGELYILRVSLSQSKIYQVERVQRFDDPGMSIYICNVTYWEELDKEETRFCVYKKLGRDIFGAINNGLLWRP